MSIQPGIYIISSVVSQTTVRSYKKGETIFVASTHEAPGGFELWEIDTATGGYTIKNVGLSASCEADSTDGAAVITSDTRTIFEITSAGEGSFNIKIANADLLWTVEAPVIPRGAINLHGGNGTIVQKFLFRLTGN